MYPRLEVEVRAASSTLILYSPDSTRTHCLFHLLRRNQLGHPPFAAAGAPRPLGDEGGPAPISDGRGLIVLSRAAGRAPVSNGRSLVVLAQGGPAPISGGQSPAVLSRAAGRAPISGGPSPAFWRPEAGGTNRVGGVTAVHIYAADPGTRRAARRAIRRPEACRLVVVVVL